MPHEAREDARSTLLPLPCGVFHHASNCVQFILVSPDRLCNTACRCFELHFSHLAIRLSGSKGKGEQVRRKMSDAMEVSWGGC